MVLLYFLFIKLKEKFLFAVLYKEEDRLREEKKKDKYVFEQLIFSSNPTAISSVKTDREKTGSSRLPHHAIPRKLSELLLLASPRSSSGTSDIGETM